MPKTPRADRRARDERRFPDADHELTNAEIQDRYGDVIREAIAAFATDVGYAIRFAESANRIEHMRARAQEAAARIRERKAEERKVQPSNGSEPHTRTRPDSRLVKVRAPRQLVARVRAAAASEGISLDVFTEHAWLIVTDSVDCQAAARPHQAAKR